MRLGERLRERITPESKKLPFEARSLEGLIQIAQIYGVKDVVAVQTLGKEESLEDGTISVEHETNYTFFTRNGRCVIYDEIHGILPKSQTDELKDLVTAASRVNLLNSHGILADVIDGWVGDRNKPNGHHKMDIGFLLHQLNHVGEQGIKAFPHPLLNGS